MLKRKRRSQALCFLVRFCSSRRRTLRTHNVAGFRSACHIRDQSTNMAAHLALYTRRAIRINNETIAGAERQRKSHPAGHSWCAHLSGHASQISAPLQQTAEEAFYEVNRIPATPVPVPRRRCSTSYNQNHSYSFYWFSDEFSFTSFYFTSGAHTQTAAL